MTNTENDGRLFLVGIDGMTIVGIVVDGHPRPLTEMEGNTLVDAWDEKLERDKIAKDRPEVAASPENDSGLEVQQASTGKCCKRGVDSKVHHDCRCMSKRNNRKSNG